MVFLPDIMLANKASYSTENKYNYDDGFVIYSVFMGKNKICFIYHQQTICQNDQKWKKKTKNKANMTKK